MKRFTRQFRVQLWRGFTCLSVLSVALLLYQTSWVRSIDDWIYDQTLRLVPLKSQQHSVIVAIDETSLREIGQWPWPRSTHARLLQRLTAAQADVVAFDILFSEESQYNDDQIFAQALQQHGKVILPVHFEPTHAAGLPIEKPPTPILYHVAYGVGHVDRVMDADGVTRQAADFAGVTDAFWPYLPLLLPTRSTADEPVAQPVLTDIATNAVVYGKLQKIYFSSPGKVSQTFSYSDVLNGKIPEDAFKGKTVLVGATALGLGDLVNTPVGFIPGVELLANRFENLQQHITIRTLPTLWFYGLLGFGTLLCLYWLSRLSPGWFLLASLTTALVGVILAGGFLALFRLWLPCSIFLLTLLLFYPLWSWQRLAISVKYLKRQLDMMQQRESSPEVRVENALQNVLPLIPELRWQFSDKPKAIPADDQSHKQWFFPQSRRYMQLQNIPQGWQSVLDDIFVTYGDGTDGSDHGVELVEHLIGRLRQFRARGLQQQTAVQSGLNQVEQHLWVADCCGTVLFQNHASASSKGLWLQLAAFHPPEDIIPGSLPQLILNGESIEFESHVDQEDYLINVKKLELQPLGYPLIVASAANITSSKTSERLREDTLRFLSHDIRSPLVSILSIIERIKREKRALMHEEEWSSIEVYAKKNLKFAQSFLQLLQAQAINPSQLYPCDADNCIEGAFSQMLPVAKAKDVELLYTPSKQESWVLGDTELLERALVNLLSNAIKFSPQGQSVCIHCQQETGQICIVVRDHAGGLSPEIEQNLFEKFQKTTENNPEGTGLGLAFVHTTISKFSGRIVVDNRLGEGLTLQLYLPKFDDWDALP